MATVAEGSFIELIGPVSGTEGSIDVAGHVRQLANGRDLVITPYLYRQILRRNWSKFEGGRETVKRLIAELDAAVAGQKRFVEKKGPQALTLSPRRVTIDGNSVHFDLAVVEFPVYALRKSVWRSLRQEWRDQIRTNIARGRIDDVIVPSNGLNALYVLHAPDGRQYAITSGRALSGGDKYITLNEGTNVDDLVRSAGRSGRLEWDADTTFRRGRIEELGQTEEALRGLQISIEHTGVWFVAQPDAPENDAFGVDCGYGAIVHLHGMTPETFVECWKSASDRWENSSFDFVEASGPVLEDMIDAGRRGEFTFVAGFDVIVGQVTSAEFGVRARGSFGCRRRRGASARTGCRNAGIATAVMQTRSTQR